MYKLKLLESIEAALKKAAKSKRDQNKQATIDDFVAKLTAQVIKNVQIRIHNVHVRFEDKLTNPESPYIAGITLEKLIFETQDFPDSPSTEDTIYKLVSLQNVSIYYNVIDASHEEEIFVSHLKPEEIDSILLENIADSHIIPEDLNYLLKPSTLTGTATINRKPQSSNFLSPVLDLKVAVSEFEMGLGSIQLESMLMLFDAMGRRRLAHPHRKLRPNVRIKHNSSLWWRFAIRSVLENDIRQKNREWSWHYISHHLKQVRDYKETYKQKLRRPQSIRLIEKLNQMETELDVFNIILARRQAESDMREFLEQKPQSNEQSNGWFSWLWGSTRQNLDESIDGTENENVDVISQIQTVMTEDEKEKLYDAIGYAETDGLEAYPKNYAAHRFCLYVDAIKLFLNDDLKKHRIAEFACLGVRSEIEHRPTCKSYFITSDVDDLVIHGIKNRRLTREDAQGKTFYFEFTRLPAGEKYDYDVYMKTSPFHLIYDPSTFDSLFRMFTRPEDTVSVQQIHFMAEEKLQQFKNLSATGLENAISPHKRLSAKIDVEPLFIVIPGGNLWSTQEACDAFILFVGKSTVRSSDMSQPVNGYDTYTFDLSEVQFFMSSSETWKEDVGLRRGSPAVVLDQDISNRSLLSLFSIEAVLNKCIMTDSNPTLPRFNLHTAILQTVFGDIDMNYVSNIRIIHGKIGILSADIPLSNLYTSPVRVNMASFLAVSAPISEEEDKALDNSQMSKRKVLESIQNALKKARRDDKKQTVDSYLSKLTAQAIKNLVVEVDNVHLRFEDRSTDKTCPYMIGMTLEKLETKCEGSATTESSENRIQKTVALRNFCVYQNVKLGQSTFLTHLATEEIDDVLLDTISDGHNYPPDLSYLLKPTNLSLNMTLTRKPQPEVDIRVAFNMAELDCGTSQLDCLLKIWHLLNNRKPVHPEMRTNRASSVTLTNGRPFCLTLGLEIKNGSLKFIEDKKPGDLPLIEVTVREMILWHTFRGRESGRGNLKAVISSDYFNRSKSGWEPFIDPWKFTFDWDMQLENFNPAGIVHKATGKSRTKKSFFRFMSEQTLNLTITTRFIEMYQAFRLTWDEAAVPQSTEAEARYQVRMMSLTTPSVNLLTNPKVKIDAVPTFENKVFLDISQVGFSLVNSWDEELVYVTLRNVIFEYLKTDAKHSINSSIGDIQVDNQLRQAHREVSIHPAPLEYGDPMNGQPAVSLSLQKLIVPHVHYFPEIQLKIKDLVFHLEELLLFKMYEFFGYNKKEDVRVRQSSTPDRQNGLLRSALSKSVSFVYLTILEIILNQIYLSVYATSHLPRDLRRLKRKMGWTLISFENAKVQLKPFRKETSLETWEYLRSAIIDHYKLQLQKQAARILGSVDFLGNPVGLINDVSEGISDLLVEGNVGGLVTNVTHGISNSAAKVMSSLSNSLEAATVDTRHREMRYKIRQENRDPFRTGLRGLGVGIMGGMTSIVTQTFDGVTSNGLEGLISGFGKGLLGTVTKPTVGMLDFATGVSSAVRETIRKIGHQPFPRRVRPPRVTSGPRGLLPPFDMEQAEGQEHFNRSSLIQDRLDHEIFDSFQLIWSDSACLLTSLRIRFLTWNQNSSRHGEVVLSVHFDDLIKCTVESNTETTGQPVRYLLIRVYEEKVIEDLATADFPSFGPNGDLNLNSSRRKVPQNYRLRIKPDIATQTVHKIHLAKTGYEKRVRIPTEYQS